MILREAIIADHKSIAAVHLITFQDFFLTQLGLEFLSIYYKSVIKSNNSICICAIENNDIVGFITGCKQSKGYNRNLIINNLFPFSLFALKTVITCPKKIIRLYKNFNKIKSPLDDGIYSEIQSIAVLPDYNGKGIGAALINEFERKASEVNLKKITLTTDFYDNDSVIGFYKKNGYNVYYDLVTYPNRRMYKLIKLL